MSRTYKTPSPSAMHLMLLCPARALARYGPEKITEPMSPKAAEGTRLHAEARAYLDHGTTPKSAPVRKIIRHLPPAGECDRTEQKVRVRVDGITWNGSIDFEHGFRSCDMKYSSSLKYAKTNAQLVDDPQRVVYSLDFFDRHDEKQHSSEWIYSQFDGKASKVVSMISRRKNTLQVYRDKIKPLAEMLLSGCEDETDWRTLPKNLESCNMFPGPGGGCPAKATCPRGKYRPKGAGISVKVRPRRE